MSRQDWINLRGIQDLSSDEINQDLDDFFSEYIICPLCKGNRTIQKKTLEVTNKAVKIAGITDLENSRLDEDSPTSDIIKEVISIKREGRKICPKCKGRRYLKRSKKRS